MTLPLASASGTAGFTMGFNDHQSFLSTTRALASSGQTAPSSIHRRSIPICSGLSGGSFGGICISGSIPAINWISGLSALFPGMMLGA